MALLNIIWPAFAMVALVFAVWFTLIWQRMGHIKRNPPPAGDFASREAAGQYFAPAAMPADNFANLFEMPVLFFVAIALLIVTRQATLAQIVLAWAYVLLRAVHSFIHIGPRNVRARFFAYLASCAVLLAMWVGFFADLAVAAHHYNVAMRAIAGAQP